MRTALCLLLFIFAPFTAQAALVKVSFQGTNSSPNAVNVFGTPVPTLTGHLIYESTQSATSTTGPTATNYANAIREVSFALSNIGAEVFSGERSGALGSVQVRDAAGSDTVSFNNMFFFAGDLDGEVPIVTNGTATRTFNFAQLTLSLRGPATSINSQALDGLESVIDLFGSQRQLQVFLSYRQSQGVTAGAWPAVSFNYNLQPVQVSSVPEPGTLGLMSLSLVGLAALSRRKQ